MHENHLPFPFHKKCVLQIDNEQLHCELATSTIEIFQSLNFRTEHDFDKPLVLKFQNPNIQSFVLSNYPFPVEHICVNESKIVDKIYVQSESRNSAPFIQAYSSFEFIVLAPVGFIQRYSITESKTTAKIIPTELLEEYQATTYIVYNKNIVIKINENSKQLDKILEQHKATSWAFVTAYNPFSTVLSDRENNIRHKQLKKLVSSYVAFEGEGKGQDEEWKPEKSLLIIGITKDDAINISRRFQQNAIVVGQYGKPAELLLD